MLPAASSWAPHKEFDRIDTDGDGLISLEEAERYDKAETAVDGNRERLKHCQQGGRFVVNSQITEKAKSRDLGKFISTL